MKMPMYYTFPAIRGIQAGREYYVSMCPLRLVPRLISFDEEVLEPELRSQRVLNKGRIPSLADYMVNNPDEYVFSAIAVSIDGEVEFAALTEDVSHYNIGSIKIPMEAKFIVNDGQHRRAAIEVALKERPELADETIAIVFFVDRGLKRCQQMFADLNRYAIRPAGSLTILYDHRDPVADIARGLVHEVDIFKNLTELEKSSISNRSSKLFTLSAIYRGTAELLGGLDSSDFEYQRQLATDFWNTVGDLIKEWADVKQGKIRAFDLRKDYIHAHSITVVALGKLGAALVERHLKDWANVLRKISVVDWHRSNPRWEGRVTIGGRISFSRNNLLLLTNELKNVVDIPLSDEESEAESAYHAIRLEREASS